MRKIISKNISDGESNGILSYISSNSFIRSYLTISYPQSGYVDKNAFYNWGSHIHLYSITNYVYLSYTFENYAISLTHYTMRGYKDSCYAKSWELYGINHENAVPIDYGDSSGICDFSNEICNSSITKTFIINSNYSLTPFSSFLFISNNGSCPHAANHFAMTGLELFGTLYSTIQIICTVSMKPNIKTLLFITIFIFD